MPAPVVVRALVVPSQKPRHTPLRHCVRLRRYGHNSPNSKPPSRHVGLRRVLVARLLGKLDMREEQHQFLALFGQPPARLTVEQAARGEQAAPQKRQPDLPGGAKIEPVTGGAPPGTTNITDKRGYAQRWQFSPRHVDNLMARGLPHLKIGKRRVRILIDEADRWMRQTYGTQRRGPASARRVLAAA